MTKLYRLTAVLAAVAVAAGASTALADPGNGHGIGNGNDVVLRADVFGSQPPGTGPDLFGVPPGGAPWVIDKGTATVRSNGEVKAPLKGLVIPTPPSNGTNPVKQIAATVYCGGTAVGTTHAVPFSTAGDAQIDETLATPLPRPCLAPAVLFNPAANDVVTTTNYIAATGG